MTGRTRVGSVSRFGARTARFVATYGAIVGASAFLGLAVSTLFISSGGGLRYEAFLWHITGLNLAGNFDFGASLYAIRRRIKVASGLSMAEIHAATSFISLVATGLLLASGAAAIWVGWIGGGAFLLGLAAAPYYSITNSTQKVFELTGRRQLLVRSLLRNGVVGNSLLTAACGVCLVYFNWNLVPVFIGSAILRVAVVRRRLYQVIRPPDRKTVATLSAMLPLAITQQLNTGFFLFETLPRFLLIGSAGATAQAIVAAQDLYTRLAQAFSVLWGVGNALTKGSLYRGLWPVLPFLALGVVISVGIAVWLLHLRPEYQNEPLLVILVPLFSAYFVSRLVFERWVVVAPRFVVAGMGAGAVIMVVFNQWKLPYSLWFAAPALFVVAWIAYAYLHSRQFQH